MPRITIDGLVMEDYLNNIISNFVRDLFFFFSRPTELWSKFFKEMPLIDLTTNSFQCYLNGNNGDKKSWMLSIKIFDMPLKSDEIPNSQDGNDLLVEFLSLVKRRFIGRTIEAFIYKGDDSFGYAKFEPTEQLF